MVYRKIGFINLPTKYKYKNWLHKEDEVVKERIKIDLKSAYSVSLTADGWQSSNMDKYVAVTSTYIKRNNDQIQFNKSLLAIRYVECAQTTINITNTIKTILDEYDVPMEKGNGFTTDNGKNYSLSCSSILHFRCIAHTLQLGINSALRNEKLPISIKNIIQTSKQIVTEIRNDNLLKNKLK